MPDDINSLRRFAAEVANLYGPEEELVEHSPVRGYLRDLLLLLRRRLQYVCLHVHVM
jgi:hypothetical protein